MTRDPFATWGALMVRFRWLVLGFWVLLLLGAGLGLSPRAARALQSGGFLVPDSESTQAAESFDRAFDGANRNTLSILFRLGLGDRRRRRRPRPDLAAEDRLAALPGVRKVDSFVQTGTPLLVSRDRQSALTLVTLDGTESEIESRVGDVRAALADVPLEHYVTGQPASNVDVRQVSESDLRHAELVTLPIVALLLLLVFRTVVAAALPLVLGASSVVLALAVMYLLTLTTDISIFALNTASMIGLGLGIDFSLIVVNRFDEELAAAASARRGRRRHDGLRRSLDRVSGVTVFVGMLVLTLLFDLLVVRSMSLAVMLVAGTALLAGLTLLPGPAGGSRPADRPAGSSRPPRPQPALVPLQQDGHAPAARWLALRRRDPGRAHAADSGHRPDGGGSRVACRGASSPPRACRRSASDSGPTASSRSRSS